MALSAQGVCQWEFYSGRQESSVANVKVTMERNKSRLCLGECGNGEVTVERTKSRLSVNRKFTVERSTTKSRLSVNRKFTVERRSRLWLCLGECSNGRLQWNVLRAV